MAARPILRPIPAPPDTARLLFRRGNKFPRAIAWFGARSFWGHLWHMAASFIATEDIDSRSWMRPDPPDELTSRIATQLGGRFDATTLTEALEDDLWIDFVADTGDDVSVSAAVARLMFAPYEVPDPADPTRLMTLPRGQLLLFGGDTAYPVATELEIHNRVIVPWNRVLHGVQDGKGRVLLGVPGNHDWFAGLDGFGRMFRQRRGQVDRKSRVLVQADPETEQIYRLGNIGHFIQWIEAFRVGHFVAKRPALPLLGYVPVQSASYWALHLAPRLDLWGADRQLRAIDIDQAAFFTANTPQEPRGLALVMADPAQAFLEPNANGMDILQALDVSIEKNALFVISGDTHHYCRETFGQGMHVTAGGGGAFLHPACLGRKGRPPPVAEFPGPRASLALALGVPWQIVWGRSGFLLHVAVAILYLPNYGIALGQPPGWMVQTGTGIVATLFCLLLGGWRAGRAIRIGVLAALTGAFIGFLPLGLHHGLSVLTQLLGLGLTPRGGLALAFALAIAGGTLAIGTFLMLLTILGLEQHQAFAALAHPGYKHFVRLRVRQDGSAIDGWVLGKIDPLNPSDRVLLVDRFTWNNPAVSSAPCKPWSKSSPPNATAGASRTNRSSG